MKLEDQVCNLEYAKRLKELGIKPKSLFYWVEFRNESSPKEQWKNVYSVVIRKGKRNAYRERGYLKDLRIYSAFTVAELGEMLPKEIISNTIHYFYSQVPSGDKKYWIIFYRNSFSEMPDCEEYDENEANARAKMLIYLIENGHIKAEK